MKITIEFEDQRDLELFTSRYQMLTALANVSKYSNEVRKRNREIAEDLDYMLEDVTHLF